MEILVVRHGVTELNVRGLLNGEIDEPLLPEGFKQAKLLVPSIPKYITQIDTSAMLRARQTAGVIGSALELPITSHPELVEVNYGAFAGTTWAIVGEEQLRRYRSLTYDFRPYGGSEASEDRERIGRYLEEVYEEGNDGGRLVVTHGGVIRHMHVLDRGDLIDEMLDNLEFETYNVERMLANLKR